MTLCLFAPQPSTTTPTRSQIVHNKTDPSLKMKMVSHNCASLFYVAIAAFACISVAAAQDNSTDFDDPLIGATVLHFDIETTVNSTTVIRCDDPGSRCVFRESQYSSHSYGDGQESANSQGSVWAAIVESAVLTVGECQPTGDDVGCVVTCNANCTCEFTTEDEDGSDTLNAGDVTATERVTSKPQPCAQHESRPPTMVPQGSAPVAAVCPKQQFTTHCPELMLNLPKGNLEEFDCFNFCGGAFVSSCDFAGSCGNLECDNKTEVGTATGQVFGCTPADAKAAGAKATGTNGAGQRSNSIGSFTMTWAIRSGIIFALGALL